MRRTNLKGHALWNGGKPYEPGGEEEEAWVLVRRGWAGRGVCSCGEVSAVLDSDNARKRWHAEHKSAVRAQ